MARNHDWDHSYVFQSDILEKDTWQDEKTAKKTETQDALWLKPG